MDVGLRTKTTLTTLIHDVYLQGLFNTHKGHQVSCLNTLNAMAAVLVLVHLEALQQLHGAGEGQGEKTCVTSGNVSREWAQTL